MKRHFLFLQGVCSPFFARLADRLATDGHGIFKINFNAGDVAYWGGRKSFSFRGRLSGLTDFLDDIYRKYGITDQIVFGDSRPVHRSVKHGEIYGIRTHVFEEGYFRPHWVTLEREGVNGHSLLPRDPEWFWEIGGRLKQAQPVEPFVSPFSVRALHDVLYHIAGATNPLLFPLYRNHANMTAPKEYVGYIRRFSMMRWWKRRDAKLIENLVGKKQEYYVLPLQLNSDAQIRDHSRFENMAEVIEFVLQSFSRHAPRNSRLVIKNHPLDMLLAGYGEVIARLEREYDVVGRVDYLESGNLELLLSHAKGLVTVNSTVGGVSLGLGCPTTTLSDPIYNLPGLTFQGGIDDFWRQGEPPDRELFRRFRNAVIYCTQVNGGFYCRKGIDLAVKNSLAILENEQSPLEALM